MTRPDLHDLTAQDIAPLEARIGAFPDAWQEFARSCYCTLLARAGWPHAMRSRERGGLDEPPPGRPKAAKAPSGGSAPCEAGERGGLDDLAAQAVGLALGIAEDVGGTQFYVPVGINFSASEKYARVVRAWRAGEPFKSIAAREHLTERRVRQIVEAWQQETFAQRQGKLDV